MTTITPNFKIPAGYEQMFLLGIGDFKFCIFSDSGGIHYGQIGNEPDGCQCEVLDFIEDSTNRVRSDCEKLNS